MKGNVNINVVGLEIVLMWVFVGFYDLDFGN